MEYYEQLTFTGKGDVEEAEETAIKLIREFEELALRRCPDKGYIVGYSGGKDSDCLVDLFFRAGVKFTIIHNHTTMDIPDTVYYIRKRFKEWRERGVECEIFYPEKSFWRICEEKKMLPFRKRRFCCELLKERQPYKGAIYSFGVRKYESASRAKNRDSIETRNRKDFSDIQLFHFDDSDKVKELDACYTNNYFIVNPMAYWTTGVRDRYIAKHNLEVNPVYEKYGLKRCGCLMCCMASPKDRQKEAKLFPKYAENLRRLCEKIAKSRTKDISGGGTLRDISPVEIYEFYFRVR